MNSQSHNADELEPEGLHGVACLVIIAAAVEASRAAAAGSSRAAEGYRAFSSSSDNLKTRSLWRQVLWKIRSLSLTMLHDTGAPLPRQKACLVWRV